MSHVGFLLKKLPRTYFMRYCPSILTSPPFELPSCYSFKEEYQYHSQGGRVQEDLFTNVLCSLWRNKNSLIVIKKILHLCFDRDMTHPYLKSLACRMSLIRYIFPLLYPCFICWFAIISEPKSEKKKNSFGVQDSSVAPPGENKEVFSVKFRESLVEDQASSFLQ